MSKLVGDHESFSAGFMPAASPPSSASKLLGDGTLGHLQRQLTRFSKIEFSGTQIGQLLDAQELVRAMPPPRGSVAAHRGARAVRCRKTLATRSARRGARDDQACQPPTTPKPPVAAKLLK